MQSSYRMRTMILLQGLILLLCFRTGSSQECAANGVCDSHERCRTWKDEGECYRSPQYMRSKCPVACSDMKKSPTRNECEDIHENCSVWSEAAECETNNSVVQYCPLSCGMCKKTRKKESVGKIVQKTESCKDNHENCSGWADMGECDKNPKYMLYNCMKSCGMCEEIAEEEDQDEVAERMLEQTASVETMIERTANFGVKQIVDGDQKEKTLDIVKKSLNYMEKSEDYLSLSLEIRNNCKNKNELCSFWASIGECQKNMAFMKIQCAPACQTCHLLDMESRCPKLPDAIPALKPGDLNSMFQRIVDTAPGNRTLTDEDRLQLAKSDMTEYSVTVHSRPSEDPVTEINIDLDKRLPPWLITFDNFLTNDECDAMIQHGYETGYKRSEDVGAQKFDGTVDSRQSKGRTSENAWCSSRNGCRDEPVPKRILDRMSDVMGIPSMNSEDFQILKYEVGQFYNTHHDYIPHQKERQCGPRILTFFLYLSDVDEGGGTDFPNLGITVMPKKGRAVLWPSVYNSEPMRSDNRFRHGALPVKAGLKFGANAWIHMYDYQTPQMIGCN